MLTSFLTRIKYYLLTPFSFLSLYGLKPITTTKYVPARQPTRLGLAKEPSHNVYGALLGKKSRNLKVPITLLRGYKVPYLFGK